MMSAAPIWVPEPGRVEGTRLAQFAHLASRRTELALEDYSSLHEWSIREMGAFWQLIWEFCEVIGEQGDVAEAFVPARPWWKSRFFAGARLNYAENLLGHSPDLAILQRDERGSVAEHSSSALNELVSRVQQALTQAGVGVGDRVAAVMTNRLEAYVVMLATVANGATFTSCSPDFGQQAIVDRFGQVDPTVLVAVDGYQHQGRHFDVGPALPGLAVELDVERAVVVSDRLDAAPTTGRVQTWADFLAPHRAEPVHFERMPFDHPAFILYSSGTTGRPKCLVHRGGGVLLKHLAEHQLHCDIQTGDRVLQVTTTGWMMWNWLASVMSSGATIVAFDGAPTHPSAEHLWKVVEADNISLFGTSAGFLEVCAKRDVSVTRLDLTDLRTITSTGSVLKAETYDYVYRHVKPDVHLASISGGTDLCGCLVAGDPTGPVWAGEIQRAALGVDVDVVDDQASSLAPGRSGELVCRSPFPSMPVALWDDPGDVRLAQTYFDPIPGAWKQGDYACATSHGGFVITGRSDATLNPGGVRIGSSEITRPAETLDEVHEAMAVEEVADERASIVLLIVVADGCELDARLASRITERIRNMASPRHVPRRILAVSALPRTHSGKLSERAVSDVLAGRPIANRASLVNPESLDAIQAVHEVSS